MHPPSRTPSQGLSASPRPELEAPDTVETLPQKEPGSASQLQPESGWTGWWARHQAGHLAEARACWGFPGVGAQGSARRKVHKALCFQRPTPKQRDPIVSV